jgi:hypothetical protein
MKQIHPVRLLLKALLLFLLANLVFAAWNPPVGRISGYNLFFPGRTRLPFGGGLSDSNISVDDLDAMFASHVISAPKQPGEFRVVLLGDSSVWGEPLDADQTLSAQLDTLSFACPAKTLRFYNLGYPHPSVLKDLLFLNRALAYQPDLVVWVLTANTLNRKPPNPFLLENYDEALGLVRRFHLNFDYTSLAPPPKTLLDKTFIGQRSRLARLFLLQSLGPVWGATGLDVAPAAPYAPLSDDVQKTIRFGDLSTPADLRSVLLLDHLRAGVALSGNVPLLFVNEPMFIATGKNSAVNYNSAYPRWAYDQYRQILASEAAANHWNYTDLWNALPQTDFSDNPLHLTPAGEHLLAQHLQPAIRQIACP